MRKSNNYFKFLEYVTYGKDHDGTVDKCNGVLECKSYVSISDIEDMYKTTFGLENQWLTFKNILINEDTLYVYYLDGENSELVVVYLLDNFKTQKELKDSITTACVKFLHDVLLEKSEEQEETKETSEKHYADYTSEDFINKGIAKECTTCSDFCEEDCIENAECASGNDVFGGCKKSQYFDTDSVQPNKTIIAKIEDINYCPNQNTCCIVSPFVHCNYNYKSADCIKAHKNFIHDCERVHKQMKAKHNPEWHHVSLATLANIDNDMLDEKRRNYMFLYHLIKDFRKYAFEIKREDVYFDLVSNVLRNIQQLYFNNVISDKACKYATRHVQAVSVEKGYFMSEREETFGFKESRSYNGTLR